VGFRFATVFGVSCVLGGLTGCGDGSSGPDEPPPPDLSTPQAAVASLEDIYSRRLFDTALTLHSPDYRFYPARPESIPFLEPGETSWAFDREVEMLERMLVPRRVTWLDQVLLEVDINEIVDSTSTLVRLSTETELKFLLGSVLLESSRAAVDFVYEKRPNGDHLLLAQTESLWPGSDVTYGELKARVEASPTATTLIAEADSVTATSAVLRGRVNPNGLPTTWWFEWGATASYGSSTVPADAGSGTALVVYQHRVEGLAPASDLHYRIVARSGWGTSRGDDLTLTTDP
jgi:hypothetical protein